MKAGAGQNIGRRSLKECIQCQTCIVVIAAVAANRIFTIEYDVGSMRTCKHCLKKMLSDVTKQQDAFIFKRSKHC